MISTIPKKRNDGYNPEPVKPNGKPWILVCFLNLGWLRVEIAKNMPSFAFHKDFNTVLMYPKWVPCVHNRNRCHYEAVIRNFDYLLMIDDDNPPGLNPLELAHLELDVVGCPTLVYRADKKDLYWNAMDWVENNPRDGGTGWRAHMINEGLQEVDAVGSGCILIKKDVLHALHGQQPWNREWDEFGYPIEGTDFAFCKRAKRKGFRIWAHYDFRCEHHKEHPIHQFTNHVLEIEERNRKQTEAQRKIQDNLKVLNG